MTPPPLPFPQSGVSRALPARLSRQQGAIVPDPCSHANQDLRDGVGGVSNPLFAFLSSLPAPWPMPACLPLVPNPTLAH